MKEKIFTRNSLLQELKIRGFDTSLIKPITEDPKKRLEEIYTEKGKLCCTDQCTWRGFEECQRQLCKNCFNFKQYCKCGNFILWDNSTNKE